MKDYKVTEEDLIGDLEGFPISVVHKMLEYQLIQNGEKDITVFQICRFQGNDGFFWDSTEEGQDFWYDVIVGLNFNLFFEKFPGNKVVIEEDV